MRVLTAHLGSLVVTVLVGLAGCKDVHRERPGDAAAAETGDALADAGDAAVGRDCTGSVGMGSDCDRMSGQVCYQGHCEYVCDVFGIVGGTLCNQWASGGGTVECCRPDEQCCGYSVDMWTCQPADEACPTPCGGYALCRESQWCAVAYNPSAPPPSDGCDFLGYHSQRMCVDSCPVSQQCGRDCCGQGSRCTGTCCAPLWSDGGVGDAGLLDGATD